jgi:hypothetical protein
MTEDLLEGVPCSHLVYNIRTSGLMMLNWLNRNISANSSCRRRLPVLSPSASSWRPSSSQRKKTTSPSLQLLNYHHSSSSSSLHRSSNSSNFAAAQPPNVSCCYSKRSSLGYAAAFSTTSDDSSGGGGDGAPLRRRRKPARSSSSNNNSDNDNTTQNSITAPTPLSSSSSSSTTGGGEAFFSPINSTTGHLLTSDEYLQLASLSPWVPCPDVVAKRVFEIASASNEDVHVDLGCGDGRLNFMAVDNTATSSSASGASGGGVKKSWGVDVDENILKKCHERLGRRFVPKKTTPTTRSDYNDDNDAGEEERLEFIQADLLKVIERQKELYQRDYQQRQQQQQLGRNDDTTATVTTTSYKNAINNDDNINDEFLQSITDKISNSTIITMYFVDNALHQLQPYLASILGGKTNVRVITIGYEMPNNNGWNASWVERVLGLTIFRYDMENVSRFPTEWNLDSENDDDDNTRMQRLEDDNTTIGDDQDVEEFLRRKRQEDMEELNRGLRIHHDEELDDFAHARAKRLGGGMNHTANNSQSTLVLDDDDDDDETWDGDFDETEEPEELMKEAHRKMVEARKASRGKMMAGVGGGGGEGKKKKKASVEATSKKPTWKKP